MPEQGNHANTPTHESPIGVNILHRKTHHVCSPFASSSLVWGPVRFLSDVLPNLLRNLCERDSEGLAGVALRTWTTCSLHSLPTSTMLVVQRETRSARLRAISSKASRSKPARSSQRRRTTNHGGASESNRALPPARGYGFCSRWDDLLLAVDGLARGVQSLVRGMDLHDLRLLREG